MDVGDSARREARTRVGRLSVHAQSSADWVDVEIEAALHEARDWPEVRVPLLNVRAVRAQWTGQDGSAIISELIDEARRHGMSAMLAIGMLHRIEGDCAGDLGALPFDQLAAVRSLLDDESQPCEDRVTGLIHLGIVVSDVQLYSLEDAVLAEAMRVVDGLDDPDRTSAGAVCRINRIITALHESLDAVEAGMVDLARSALERLVQLDDEGDWTAVPDEWRAEIRAVRRVAELVVADDTMSPDESEDLIGRLDGSPGFQLLVQLVTPVGAWRQPPDLSQAKPQSGSIVRFLLARALARDAAPSELADAHRSHAQHLATRAWEVRNAAAEAFNARVEAHRLRDEHQELRLQTLVDPLTRVYNRRAFEGAIRRSDGAIASLLTVDLDRFKRVNDRWGHHVGDQVLQRVAGVIAGCLGIDLERLAPPDVAPSRLVLARTGGDEFAVLALGVDGQGGRALADTIVGAVCACDWSDVLDTGSQHVSVGVATGICGTELLARSDEDMFAQKRHETRLSS